MPFDVGRCCVGVSLEHFWNAFSGALRRLKWEVEAGGLWTVQEGETVLEYKTR